MADQPAHQELVAQRLQKGATAADVIQHHTTQRPKSLENCGADVELKARSQPTGTRLDARSSDGRDLSDAFLDGAGILVRRSPLSARSTTCSLAQSTNQQTSSSLEIFAAFGWNGRSRCRRKPTPSSRPEIENLEWRKGHTHFVSASHRDLRAHLHNSAGGYLEEVCSVACTSRKTNEKSVLPSWHARLGCWP